MTDVDMRKLRQASEEVSVVRRDMATLQERVKLDFIKLVEGHNLTEFVIEPQGDSTQVRWTMAGPAPFISTLMGVFVRMDKIIGKDFETDLANLKNASET